MQKNLHSMAKCWAGFATVSITPKQEKHVKLSFLNEIA